MLAASTVGDFCVGEALVIERRAAIDFDPLPGGDVMGKSWVKESLCLGMSLCVGSLILGGLLGRSLIEFKEYERSVTVKGLAEREVEADIAIWPIEFISAGNELEGLYEDLEAKTGLVVDFLGEKGFEESEITVNVPSIDDKQARGHVDPSKIQFRYSATQIVTIYSRNVARVRESKKDLIRLGKAGLALSEGGYRSRTEYIFSGLNEIKPGMVEEATRKAREVAEKFAQDSNSELGKIKRARQGQFSITDRDSNNPHIKKVRVVNTVEYYLSD
jgi:hypothetical protein